MYQCPLFYRVALSTLKEMDITLSNVWILAYSFRDEGSNGKFDIQWIDPLSHGDPEKKSKMIRGEPAAAAAGSLFLDRCTPGVFPALIFAAVFPEISGHWAGLIIFKSADIKCCMEVTAMIPAASATQGCVRDMFGTYQYRFLENLFHEII